MKIHKKIFALFLCFVLVGSALPVRAAGMKKVKQHKLYIKTIESYARKARSSYKRYIGNEPAGYKVMYTFADIDQNGIDELILRYGEPKVIKDTAKSSGYGESTSIYTIKNKKVKKVIENTDINPYLHNNYVRVYKNRKRISIGFSHGYNDDTFYTYKNGKLLKKGKITLVYDFNFGYGFRNGKKISRKTYLKEYKKLTNKNRGYQLEVFHSKKH